MFGKTIAIFALFFVLSSTDASALQHYFKNAKKAEDAGNYDKALSLYNRVLERYPYETKSILKAYDHILNIYKIKKDNQSIKTLLAYLKNNYPDRSFDLRDVEKLSLIYSRYGEEDEAIKLQWKIIDEPYPPLYTNSVLRTYSRLLKYYKEKRDADMVSSLLYRLSSLSITDFDSSDIYEYAMLFLKYGDEPKAITTLKGIVQNHPNTVASRKSLYILAEKAQKAKDYDGAIKYYSTYIEKYPQNTFYVQKAYQRIVDCYILKGDKRVSEGLMKQVADWLNGVSDYRSQLNLAIDLKFKNMEGLSEATFYTGYHKAKKVIAENPGTYEALKSYLEIQRAAHAVGKFDIVEDAAIATLRDFNNLKGNTEFNKSVNFIKSQAHLWLAMIYRKHERYDETIKMLEDFLRLYPEHKDREYALYELGRVYENKGTPEKARELYMLVTSEPLKSMAKRRLAAIK